MTYNYNAWLKNPIKIFCKCDCGSEIIINPSSISQYKQYGIPEYIRGHNNRGKKLPPLSEKHKQKLSERVFTKEWKDKLSETKIGRNNPMFGKKHTIEHTKKLSLNHRDISGKNNPMNDSKLKLKASIRMSNCLGDKSPN